MHRDKRLIEEISHLDNFSRINSSFRRTRYSQIFLGIQAERHALPCRDHAVHDGGKSVSYLIV